MKARKPTMNTAILKSTATVTFSSLVIMLGIARPFAIAMIVFMCLDYASGMLKAFYLKKVDSKTATKGLIKKMAFLLCFFTGWAIQYFTGLPAGIPVSAYILITEIISILENLAACDIPVPKFVFKYFKQAQKDILNGTTDTKESEDDKNESDK